jgi:acyl-CoA thioester hydrolase
MTMTPKAWPDLAGQLVTGGHVLPVRVYFEDTDFSGLVYHASYLRFMERGRSDMMRLLGVSHDALDEGVFGERLAFAVRHMELDFLQSARIDDFLEIETDVVGVAGARLMLSQSICRGSAVLVKAKVTIVMINASRRARRLPKAVRDKLSAISP